MERKRDDVPGEIVDLYRAAIDTQPDIELKGAKKLPHTSINGYMYSSLSKDGRMGLRLPDDERHPFMAKYDTVPFKNYGANVKEHVEVPEELLHRPNELGSYLAMSRDYTLSLPPKK